MKIALVLDDSLDRPDGVQQYVLGLGEWMRSQGHEIHYLVGATSRQDLVNVHPLSRNWQVTFNGNRLSTPLPANTAAIRELLTREQFDVLHVQLPYSPLMAQRVILAAPVSTVIIGTFHILPYSGLVRKATRLLGWWLRPSLRRFNRIYAVSPAAKPFAEQAFGLNNVDVLPNVVGLSAFKTAQPMPGLAVNDEPVIMFLGRLVARKGCDTFLRAVARLREDYDKPFKVVVCGKGELDAELRSLAGRLGLDDIVHFTGFVSEVDKPSYMTAATIMAFPSTGGESFGIVLVEAMAAGGPVVLAANNPGYASVMEPQPGLLFAVGDVAALATRMAYYLRNRTDRQTILDWQREYIGQFDTAVVGQALLTEYRLQLQKKRPA